MSPLFRPDHDAPRAERAGSSTVSVSIAKPAGIGLGVWMSRLRDWLDQHHIEPVDFRPDGEGWGGQTYEVSFADVNDADRFAAAFEPSTSTTAAGRRSADAIASRLRFQDLPGAHPHPNSFMQLTAGKR
ncbi:MAG: hypothetical protein JO305_04920 [Alphaproteobacteria bacterium]|nr:hypothetical protein [Alphaproteobacteria bacterium]